MKVSIIGHGFVGKALDEGLNNKVNKMIIDPIYNNKISDLESFQPEFIFICVPTPMIKNGDQDLEILKSVIEEINNLNFDSQVVLKSTVLPSHIEHIATLIPNIVYNPEFLTERHASKDFINAEFIILGGKNHNTDKTSNFYQNHTKCITSSYFKTDLIAASFIKYTINCFLASKVMFFNELHDLFCQSGTDETWENFIEAISLDKRMGSSHMQVPGPDGRFGFGGACFPKDSQALYKYSESKNSPLQILKKVIELNNSIRNSYESATKREIDQNVDFSSNK